MSVIPKDFERVLTPDFSVSNLENLNDETLKFESASRSFRVGLYDGRMSGADINAARIALSWTLSEIQRVEKINAS